jgi:outer membrane protein, multidrug efflux system
MIFSKTQIRWVAPLMGALLQACTVVGPQHVPPPLVTVASSPAWVASLPHGGTTQDLLAWWSTWNDPALQVLIDAGQSRSASLEQAAARIRQARASARIAGSDTLPAVSASGNVSRGNTAGPTATALAVGAQAAWEMDLFGGKLRGREAAEARVQARGIDWHDARVSVAAEIATAYAGLRVNEALLRGFELDHRSRAETARLTVLKANAGFEAPANAALAQASVADAQARVLNQHAEIDLGIKAIVALTALSEPEVRTALAPQSGRVPQPLALAVDTVPASVLAQRPDLAAIERDIAAASAEIGVAEADRYPRISFSGSIGYSVSRALGATTDGGTFGFGPSISIPLFDAGRRVATVDLATARLHELAASYKATASRAVREVEEALTRLNSARVRAPEIQNSLIGYEAFAKAADSRLRAGVGSVLELEDARRAVLNAQVSAINLDRERLLAWISLYRAMGGGWTINSKQGSL